LDKITKVPASVKAARALFYVNAAVWMLLGAASLVRMAGNSADPGVTLLVVAMLMFGNAAAMLWGLGLGKQNRLFYFFAIAVLVVNIILTFTDQFGVLDFATLAIDVVLFGLLIATRARYQLRKTGYPG
jgi:hypothetical protein